MIIHTDNGLQVCVTAEDFTMYFSAVMAPENPIFTRLRILKTANGLEPRSMECIMTLRFFLTMTDEIISYMVQAELAKLKNLIPI